MSAPATSPVTFGGYRILRKISRGATAEVMLAAHPSAPAPNVVVLKRLLPEWSAVDEVAQIFLAEARVAQTLQHPSISRVFDVGRIDGQCYLAMEYLPGEDLASVIQQARRVGQLLPVEAAVEAVYAACEGLQAAHARPQPVIHRDLSPSNVVVTFDGRVKLIDFGIGRANRGKGKIQYMSPEQAAGLPVDPRTDVFAAGIILHELLTTHRLFRRANDQETLHALLQAPIPAPSSLRNGVSAELDRICLTALAREPKERYPSALAMADDLDRFVGARHSQAQKTLVYFLERVFPEDRREKKLRVAAGALPEPEKPEGLTPLRTDPRIGTAAVARPAQPLPPKPGLVWLLVAAAALLFGGFGLGTLYRTGCGGTVTVEPTRR